MISSIEQLVDGIGSAATRFLVRFCRYKNEQEGIPCIKSERTNSRARILHIREEKASKILEEIHETGTTIDQMVYDLYGLTEEKIAVLVEASGE